MLKTVYREESAIRVLHSGGRLTCAIAGTEYVTICAETVYVIDSKTGVLRHSFGGEGDAVVTAVAVSSTMLCVATADLQLLLYNFDVASPNYTLIKQWPGASNTSISCLAFSKDGEALCSACADGSAKVWDVARTQLTHTMQNAEGVVTTATFLDMSNNSETTQWIAFGSFEGKVTVWDLKTKKKVQTISENVGAIDSVVHLASINAVVICGLDRRVVCLQRKSAKALLTILHSFVVKENVSAMMSYDGLTPTVLTASEDGHVAMYNLSSLPAVTQAFHRSPSDLLGEGFTSMTYCAASNEAVLVSNGHNVLVMDGSSGVTSRCLVGYTDQVLGLQHIPSLGLIAAVTNAPTVHLFRPGECVSVRRLIGHTDLVLCVAVSPDERFLATGGKDHTIRVWDTTSPTLECVAILSGHSGEVTSLGFTNVKSSSVLALVSVSADECMKVWVLTPLKKSTKLLKLTCPPEHTVARVHAGGIFCATFSPNDQTIASAGRDKIARMWSWSPKEGCIVTGELKGHKRAVYYIAFSPVERIVATASGDKTIKLWNTSDCSCVRTLQGHENTILSVNFFNKGLQLVSASGDGMLKVWSVNSGQCVTTLDGHEDKVWCISVINDGEMFVSGGADAAIVEWKNITEETKQEVRENNAKRVVEQQELENCIREARYEEAFLLALKLGHTKQLHDVISSWREDREMVLAVQALSEEDLKKLLYFCRDWLVVAKRARVAHLALNAVLVSRHPSELLKYGEWAKEVIDACQSYTLKYYNRVSTQLQDLHYVDFLEHCANPTAAQKRLREGGDAV